MVSQVNFYQTWKKTDSLQSLSVNRSWGWGGNFQTKFNITLLKKQDKKRLQEGKTADQ